MDSFTYDDVHLIPTQKSTVDSRWHVSTEITIQNKSGQTRLRAPIIAAPMDTVVDSEMATHLCTRGLVGILHRFQSIDDQVAQLTRTINQSFLTVPLGDIASLPRNFGFAIGAKNYERRLEKLLTAWSHRPKTSDSALFVCIDVANGFTSMMEKAVAKVKEQIKDEPNTFLIAGNVAGHEGFSFLQDLGVDIVRVGIGSGSACTTSVTTGIGQGILTAVDECVEVQKDTLVMADGGIRSSGDIIKALVLGADLVMVGSLFAGFEESPGHIFTDKTGTQYKIFRGMASEEAAATIGSATVAPEGVVHRVPFKGKISPFIERLLGGIRSGMSYLNTHNMKELAGSDVRVRIATYNSHVERTPFIKSNGLH